MQQCLKENQRLIRQYEQAGDYTAALVIARNSYADALKKGFTDEANRFSTSVKRLEEELLAFGSKKLLFDENFEPRPKLLQLLKLMNMIPLQRSEKAILQINHWAQKNLLRQGERWEQQKDHFDPLTAEIQPLLCDLGFVEECPPHFQEYQGALIHGALLRTVRLRLQYLIEQWQKGIRFSDLYFLSGARPLEPLQESRDHMNQEDDSLLKIRKDWKSPVQFPKTEYEMVQLVWDQATVPETMRKNVHVHFINAPMKKDPKSDKLLRPTTDDTILYWIQSGPTFGRYIAITNAPNINRQDLVVRALAPEGYGFDTVGIGANKQETIPIFLDELARYIFQVKQLSEK